MIDPSSHRYLLHSWSSTLSISDESVPLVIASPPAPMQSDYDDHWILQDGSIDSDLQTGEGISAFTKMHDILRFSWQESHRILEAGGVLAVFIQDIARTVGDDFRLYANQSKIINACSKVGFDLLPSILISTPNPKTTKYVGSGLLPVGAYVPVQHSSLLFFRKRGKREFKKSSKILRAESALFWEERNRWFGEMWSTLTHSRADFYSRVIAMWSIYGDSVVDLYAIDNQVGLQSAAIGRSSIQVFQEERLLGEASASFTKRSTKGSLNVIVEDRLSAHMRYVNTKDLLYFRYKNEKHGLPVKSTQEKNLSIYAIKSVTRDADEVQVRYANLKKDRVNELIEMAFKKEEG